MKLVRRDGFIRALLAAAGLLVMSGSGFLACGSSASRVTKSPALRDREVHFNSGPDTLYGSLLAPPSSAGRRSPAALIISGSGPTDRNGNSPLIKGPVDTNLNFALALAADGVVSLRYDKLGTGKTGLASHSVADLQNLSFSILVNEAQAAYEYLRSSPQVDPSRVFILGHSEGALIALILADTLPASEAPAALVLAAPPGTRILDTIRGQIAAQLTTAQQQGALSSGQATATLTQLDRVNTSIRQTGQLPQDVPAAFQQQFQAIFNQANVKAIASEDAYDPPQLAAKLPSRLPVLILRGSKDQQISAGDVQNLLTALSASGHQKVSSAELANVDHVFKEVPGEPNPAVDYGNPELRFSREAVTLLSRFVAANVQTKKEAP